MDKNLKVVIPMSGLGTRFLNAGYTEPKPLIPVHGRPIIDWVFRLFPGTQDPLFICRREHIEQTQMKKILMDMCPTAEIAIIDGHKKGPVDALIRKADHIPDDRPILVSYCDYYMHWDYASFCKKMADTKCDGAVPCYTGFHPHLIPEKNLYACCRTDGQGWLQEIREKHTFEADKMKALHSPGVYYFRSGEILKKYGQRMIDLDDNLNGEYYASMVYNHLLKDGLKVFVPTDIPHFCQWGTPEDMRDYLQWINVVKGVLPVPEPERNDKTLAYWRAYAKKEALIK